MADYREKIKVTHILIHILWISMNTAMILTIRCTCCNHRMTDDLFCFFSQNKDNYPQVDKIKIFFHRGAASLFLTATGKVVILTLTEKCIRKALKPFNNKGFRAFLFFGRMYDYTFSFVSETICLISSKVRYF